jgi:Na+/H+ antiporter NhaA
VTGGVAEDRNDGTLSRALVLQGRTTWRGSVEQPLRAFLQTETSGAAVLLAATFAALVWANVAGGSYERAWGTVLAVQLDGHTLSLTLRDWVSSGLMTFFFFVLGLETRRQFDMGDLRERRRLTLPLLAALGGMTVTVVTFLAITAGSTAAGGWGTAMSTDTAFALGALALVGPASTTRLRAFLLTVAVVDDLAALLVIAVVYPAAFGAPAFGLAVALFGVVLLVTHFGVHHGAVYFVLGLATWVALEESGIDPIVIGLAMGLLTYARPAERSDLDQATQHFRRFREQPTPELARSAGRSLRRSVSPNDRLQRLYHPWTSYAIVPLFALANAGVPLDPDTLRRALTSPVTLGILAGYVVGKPLGLLGVAWLTSRLSGGRLRPPVGWLAVAGGGTIAGIGFTMSILVATRAFSGGTLEEAKIGAIGASLAAAAVTWVVFRIARRLPGELRIRALAGGAGPLVDLDRDVDREHDHIRGPEDAPVTIVEYGDFECTHCGRAEHVIRELLREDGGVRYVWRHLPLEEVHHHADLAARASEAAAAQGQFWEMFDLLLEHQDSLLERDIVEYAQHLGLDLDRFRDDIGSRGVAAHIAADVESADLSGVSGTPTFFVNGRRHEGAYDLESLKAMTRRTRARTSIAA